jgi:hypothetical protein
MLDVVECLKATDVAKLMRDAHDARARASEPPSPMADSLIQSLVGSPGQLSPCDGTVGTTMTKDAGPQVSVAAG